MFKKMVLAGFGLVIAVGLALPPQAEAQVRVGGAENYGHYEAQKQRSQRELPHLHVLRDKRDMAWWFAHWITMIAGGWSRAREHVDR